MKLQHYIKLNEEQTTQVIVVDKDGASAILPITAEQLEQMRTIWAERWTNNPIFRMNQQWGQHEYSMTPDAIRKRDARWKNKLPQEHVSGS